MNVIVPLPAIERANDVAPPLLTRPETAVSPPPEITSVLAAAVPPVPPCTGPANVNTPRMLEFESV